MFCIFPSYTLVLHCRKELIVYFDGWDFLNQWDCHYFDCSSEDIWSVCESHYSDIIMGAMTSQITSLTIVSSTLYSGVDQRKLQSSASLAFVRGIHRWPVNSPHKWPVTGKTFPFDDVIIMVNVDERVKLWIVVVWVTILSTHESLLVISIAQYPDTLSTGRPGRPMGPLISPKISVMKNPQITLHFQFSIFSLKSLDHL